MTKLKLFKLTFDDGTVKTIKATRRIGVKSKRNRTI